MVGEEMRRQGIKFEYANARLEDRGALLADIERVMRFAAMGAARDTAHRC